MTMPLVTCGITSCNAASTIEHAVRSAFAQSWRPIEVIVVDDCSTDETLDILHRLRTTFSDLRVARNDRNLGVAATRNRILSDARGEFVAFFDDDDESHPQRVAQQISRITQYEKDFAQGRPVICHTARRQIYPDGRVEISPTMGQQAAQLAPSGLDVARYILAGKRLQGDTGPCATSSQMSRRATYRLLGGFDPSFRRSEDTEFNVRLAKAGGHFVGIAEPLVSQTMTYALEKRLSEELHYALLILEKHRDLFDDTRQYYFCRRWVENKHVWLQGRRGATLSGFGRLMLSHPLLSARRFFWAREHAAHNHSLRRFHDEAGSRS